MEELFDNHGYSLSLPPHHCCYHFTDCLDDVDSICDCLKIIFFNIKQTSWYFVRFVVSDGFGNLSESLLIAFTCRLENFLIFHLVSRTTCLSLRIFNIVGVNFSYCLILFLSSDIVKDVEVFTYRLIYCMWIDFSVLFPPSWMAFCLCSTIYSVCKGYTIRESF